jgi:hypothetical protein
MVNGINTRGNSDPFKEMAIQERAGFNGTEGVLKAILDTLNTLVFRIATGKCTYKRGLSHNKPSLMNKVNSPTPGSPDPHINNLVRMTGIFPRGCTFYSTLNV